MSASSLSSRKLLGPRFVVLRLPLLYTLQGVKKEVVARELPELDRAIGV
jgi:hypothetical protein